MGHLWPTELRMNSFFKNPSRLIWKLLRFSRRVWVRVTMISILAIVAAAAAPLLQTFIPEKLSERIGASSVRPILNVLASSMLAVTTFSLSVMVSAHRAASDQVSPRTHRLLLADTTTQTVLATFLGAFIYALTSIVLINASVYDARTITVSFFATVFVILLVVIAILRWIEHLSRLGSMLETTRVVERAATDALNIRLAAPWLGGQPEEDAPDTLAHKIFSDQIGYVGHVDAKALAELAEEEDCDIRLLALPGSLVAPNVPLALASREDHAEAIRAAFTIGDTRGFDQDPRFGLIVLSEIASRALSPGINDPGTAIDVIGRLLRILNSWERPDPEKAEAEARVFLPCLDPTDLVEDGFGALARDGADMVEVQLRLQKALAALAGHDDARLAEAAREMAARAYAHAAEALRLSSDLKRVKAELPDGVEGA